MTDPLTTNKTFLTPYKYFIDTSGATEDAASADDYYVECTGENPSIYCTIQNAYSDYKGYADEVTHWNDIGNETGSTTIGSKLMSTFTSDTNYTNATNATSTFTTNDEYADSLFEETTDANDCDNDTGDCTVATDLSANRANYETSRANQETVRNSIFSLEAQRKEYGEKAARNSLFYVLLIILILFIIIIIIKLLNS